MEFLQVIIFSIFIMTTITTTTTAQTAASTGSATTGKQAATFVPQDNYLIDCGSTSPTKSPQGKSYKTDAQAASMLATKDNILVSTPSTPEVPSPIYLTARIFKEEAAYSFHVVKSGWHWVRLHFYPVKNKEFDLTHATFSVKTMDLVLLHSFNINNASTWVKKEYLVNVTSERFTLKFEPLKNSAAYINAIEIISAPDALISNLGSSLVPIGDFNGLFNFAYQTIYRLNVGGPLIMPQNDTLGRTWNPDKPYLKASALAQTKTVAPSVIKYPQDLTPLIAPNWVYASAVEMADARIARPNFNISWTFNVDPSFGYLLRFHFCDVVSESLNDLYFNVYINGIIAISSLDLSTITGGLAVPYYKDIVVNATTMNDHLTVQIGPTNQNSGTLNALLNGLEVLKMSNSVGSLDGEFGVDGRKASVIASTRGTVAAVGFAMMFGAFVGLGAMVMKWHRRPQDWEKRNSFSSWLLPLHAGNSTFMTSKTSMGSQKGAYNFSSTMGLGRYFSFSELTDATKNWDQNAVIGVGGFGNVYLGEIDDGTKIAVKRGNPQSEQGINEFQTEIQMLSKLRHRHLVSLIGYCDENTEMILVYEYMANGPLRDHLYGKEVVKPLSWKERLEVCIGAARGLHYLHTGAAQGIIHRDVKTTNILLDENLVSKMSDFGLSKNAPTMEQTHVSTAVKGSFGYLDPEYFRRQQLTDKSDVYSFGVVLLEVLCARPALNPALPREQVNLAEWALQWKRKGLLDKIVDPQLHNDMNGESMKKFAEAAEKCLAEFGVDRPSMGDVLWNLEYALQLQEAALGKNGEDSGKPGVVVATEPIAPAPIDPVKALSLLEESDDDDDNAAALVQAVPEHSGMPEMFARHQLSGR